MTENKFYCAVLGRNKAWVYAAEPLNGSQLYQTTLKIIPREQILNTAIEEGFKTVSTYLWLILPINIELPIKSFEGQPKASPSLLIGGLNNILPALAIFSQTFSFPEAHFGL